MWFEENQGDFFKQSIKVEERVFEKKSDYQQIEIYRSNELGHIMVLDGAAMLSEKDEFIYHEMLAHVPICTHREPKRVLIIGGGDGGTAREVLKHKEITVDMVELDEAVIEASQAYFPAMADVWGNERLRLHIQSGLDFIAEAEDQSYDIILVDATDPKGKAEELFEATFYAQANRVLKEDGLIATQGSSWWMALEEHKRILKNIGNLFQIAMPYRYEMMVYPGCVWNFILASKKYHPTADINLQRADLLEPVHYYNSDIHKASFTTPAYIKKELLGIAKN
ncbi:MAG: spermidine synthase [Campylobacteraceae bacterium 4484_4]|nr:MAG: spermidine synthase [Campylobacteraceae bacterium 4484_4]